MSKRKTYEAPEKTLTTKAEHVWFVLSLTFLSASFAYAIVEVLS